MAPDPDVIVAHLRLTEDDIVRPMCEGNLFLRLRWLYVVSGVSLAAMYSLWGGRMSVPQVMGGIAYPLAFAAFIFFIPKLAARRQLKALNAAGGTEVSYRFDTDGFTMRTPGSTASFAYRVLSRARESRSAFLLYCNPAVATAVPKRTFTEEQTAQVRALLTAHAKLKPVWRLSFRRGLLWILGGCFGLLFLPFFIWRIAQPDLFARIDANDDARACDRGDAQSCRELGDFFDTRPGVGRDAVRATSAYRRGCDLGDGRACTLAGYRTREGIGVTRYLDRAVAYLSKACKLDQAQGCYFLGETLLDDHRRDEHGKARPLFERACTLGDGWGCLEARHFGSNVANARDEEATFRIAKKNCDAGLDGDCFNLGLAYREGMGVPADREKGLRLMREACARGAINAACAQPEGPK